MLLLLLYCLRLCIFLSVVGLLVLLPVYYTVPSDAPTSWYTFTIQNIDLAPEAYRHRLWLAAWLGYIYAAYFCQLMYTEYEHFSGLRLSYLTKVCISVFY